MTDQPLLPAWRAETASLWGRQPLQLPHNLHRSALFSRAALTELIETYPRSHYALVHMGGQTDRRLWQEGDIGSLNGTQVLDAIAHGRMWLNLRDVATLEPRYGALLEEMFATFAARIPGFSAPRRSCGILISSPLAQVYYHADLPGQLLCQIEGKKRVYVYPKSAPFLTDEHVEDIALFDMELDVPYEPWYDDHARIFTLEPGQFLQWPLNAPHRVENLDMLNVSMTISFSTEEIRRLQTLNLANGILRHRFGLRRPGRGTAGVPYWSKAVLQKALRGSRWIKAERAARRRVTFKLDADQLGTVKPITSVEAAE